MTVPSEPPRGPDAAEFVFFLSYARPHPGRRGRSEAADRQGWVARFFDELSGHVAELVGTRAGNDPGFLDQAMAGGEAWANEVLDAVRTASVFVPLISPSYFQSEWCSREWQEFSRRQAVPGANRPAGTVIVPVTWLPTEDVHLPEVVQKVQWFGLPHSEAPDIIERYMQHGLYGLLALREEDDYHRAVWYLAKRVAGIYISLRPDPGQVIDLAREFGNAFHQEKR